MTDELDKIYTTDEAAERLRLTRRAIIKMARDRGLCSRVGRNVLFSEADLLALWQAIREPVSDKSPLIHRTPAPLSRTSLYEDLKWFGDKPPTKVDARVLGVLKWLATQRQPKTYKQIDRAGPRTIELLVEGGFVTQHGTDDEGNPYVKIAPPGRDEIKTFERWVSKRAARRQSTGR